MRALVQRVRSARVEIDGACHGRIGHGLCVFLGVHGDDTANEAVRLVEKLVNLRIFCDDQDKMNRSLLDVSGEILLVSQFTLYADCAHGRRPSFIEAARPEVAIPLYEQVQDLLRAKGILVATGVFGADMQVSLVNDGPVTIWLDTADLKK